MCGCEQKPEVDCKKICPGVYFFLPLVVDATGPAQANYSLPGLFISFPQPEDIFSVHLQCIQWAIKLQPR
jgi:hypothetical protein